MNKYWEGHTVCGADSLAELRSSFFGASQPSLSYAFIRAQQVFLKVEEESSNGWRIARHWMPGKDSSLRILTKAKSLQLWIFSPNISVCILRRPEVMTQAGKLSHEHGNKTALRAATVIFFWWEFKSRYKAWVSSTLRLRRCRCHGFHFWKANQTAELKVTQWVLWCYFPKTPRCNAGGFWRE